MNPHANCSRTGEKERKRRPVPQQASSDSNSDKDRKGCRQDKRIPVHTYPIINTKVATRMQNRAFAERSTMPMMHKDTARLAHLKQSRGNKEAMALRVVASEALALSLLSHGLQAQRITSVYTSVYAFVLELTRFLFVPG